MSQGDHLYIHYLGYSHHGIDCGDGTVIVYRGYFNGGKVTRLSKSEFADGKEIRIQEYGNCDTPSVVVARAESRLGESGYCLVSNNCEHFAYWCKTGLHKSKQVENGVSGAAAFGVKAGTGVATKFATDAATKAAIQGLNPLAKGLVQLGLKQAPKVVGRAAVGIAGAGGFVTGMAAELLVNKLLEDDEHLPADEREARELGRTAGQVASVVGGIGGTVAAATMGGTVAIASAVAAPAVLGIAVGLGVHHLLKKKD